jgi:putative metalloprotease
MFKLTPLILALAYAFLMMQFSVWRSKKTLREQSSPLTHPAILRQAARLAAALEIDQIKVNLLEMDAVNGLAAPDGQIYLTRGFIAAHERGEVSETELAAVIAHELGHVALGHARRRMIDFTGQNAVFMVLSGILNRFLPVIGIWIARLISTALMARLSQRDEYEADAFATALLNKAGIGAAPQISLFEKLEVLTGDKGATALWLASHPPSAARIAAIRAREAQWSRP